MIPFTVCPLCVAKVNMEGARTESLSTGMNSDRQYHTSVGGGYREDISLTRACIPQYSVSIDLCPRCVDLFIKTVGGINNARTSTN